jgi:hypothetical protein
MLDARHLSQRRQIAPGLAAILTHEQMRRQRAGIEKLAPIKHAGPHRPDVEQLQAVIDPAPSTALVVGARDALPVRPGDQRAVGQPGDGRDRAALQGPVRQIPFPALGPFKHIDAVRGTDDQPVGCLVLALDIVAARRQ